MRKSKAKTMVNGDVFKMKSNGPLVVLNYFSMSKVIVRFINTGTEKETYSQLIRRGLVKDPFLPLIYGVGFIGVGKHKAKINGVPVKKYNVWKGMIARCYSSYHQKRAPSYIGCTVCNEWHNYQNFADWHDKSYKEGLHLDKDIKIKGNREYGPNTCLFVTQAENNLESVVGLYIVKSPEGVLQSVVNMKLFCDKNKLCRFRMYKLGSGKISEYNGWSVTKMEPKPRMPAHKQNRKKEGGKPRSK